MNGIFRATEDDRLAFAAACGQEHVYGSKILTALAAFGLNCPSREFYFARGEQTEAALYLSDGVLLIASGEAFDMDSLPQWIASHAPAEIDCRLPLALRLQDRLGGMLESSYFMEYTQSVCPSDGSGIIPAADLSVVYSILRQSHDYYRTHLRYESWLAEMTQKIKLGLTELVVLVENGQPVATGSISSHDEETACVAAVAVIPSARHRGIGRKVSAYLTDRILQTGKKPVLISGYDEVAELYRQVGYTECGRWGELYL